MKEEVKYRQVIVDFGKLLHERGYVAPTDANLSVRLDCQSILITPTCLHPLSESGGLCAGLQFRFNDGNSRQSLSVTEALDDSLELLDRSLLKPRLHMSGQALGQNRRSALHIFPEIAFSSLDLVVGEEE